VFPTVSVTVALLVTIIHSTLRGIQSTKNKEGGQICNSKHFTI